MDIWKCKRCGRCCRLFVYSSVQLTKSEWGLFKDEIKSSGITRQTIKQCEKNNVLPAIGEKPPKTCVFLKKNLCTVHSKRPQRCKEYPLGIQIGKDFVNIVVSDDCPRGEKLYETIKGNPPLRLKKIMRDKKVNVFLYSFFEKTITQYYDEEE